MNHHPVSKAPRRKDDRIILQFVRAHPSLGHTRFTHACFLQDYDCFYAQVYENKDPKLKGRPLGVKQKNILATCNYAARSLGIKKLGLVIEAKRICPNLILIDGEDLTPFRDTSKVLFNLLKSYSWNNKVERLGLDEVFMGRSASCHDQPNVTDES